MHRRRAFYTAALLLTGFGVLDFPYRSPGALVARIIWVATLVGAALLYLLLVRDEAMAHRRHIDALEKLREQFACSEPLFRDLKKRAEAEQIRIQKLESVRVLAGGIAHDFNNLLAAILGDVSVAKEHAPEGSVVREVLDEAEAAALRARDLTKQLLTFSRGGLPVKKTIALGSVLEKSSSFALRGSRATREWRLPGDLWLVEADESQIGQVVQNLVLNAVQAMPGGGVVTVAAENLTAEAALAAGLAMGRCVRVTICDQGAGVPADLGRRVFDPYFTTKPTGSGLGLASAHSIVAHHGGHIGFQSAPGQGASFFFVLPAVDGRVESEPATRYTARKDPGEPMRFTSAGASSHT